MMNTIKSIKEYKGDVDLGVDFTTMSRRYVRMFSLIKKEGTELESKGCSETGARLEDFDFNNPFGNLCSNRIVITYTPGDISHLYQEAIEFPKRVYRFMEKYEKEEAMRTVIYRCMVVHAQDVSWSADSPMKIGFKSWPNISAFDVLGLLGFRNWQEADRALKISKPGKNIIFYIYKRRIKL